MNNLIYISGAITGTTDFLERFQKAEDELAAKGYRVVNPAKVCSYLPQLSHSEYMNICIEMLKPCDSVYFLEDWVNSIGACFEYQFSMLNDKIIKFAADERSEENDSL